MTTTLPALVLAFQAQAAEQPTVLIARETGPLGWVSVLADIATILIAVALIAVALAMIAAAWNSRKIYQSVHRLMERLHTDAQPVMVHARDVADNVNYISAAIRADVEELRVTVRAAQENLLRASDAAEQRIGEFNALLGVVQEEAERAFISTASTARGLRAGAGSLKGSGAKNDSPTPSISQPQVGRTPVASPIPSDP